MTTMIDDHPFEPNKQCSGQTCDVCDETKGRHVMSTIHRITSNFDLIDKPIDGLKVDCGSVIAHAERVPVEELVLGQRLPSFTTKDPANTACYFCANLGSLRSSRGIWESYWK